MHSTARMRAIHIISAEVARRAGGPDIPPLMRVSNTTEGSGQFMGMKAESGRVGIRRPDRD